MQQIYPTINVCMSPLIKIAYVTQKDEFVTEMVNVIMLTRLNENIRKMQFLDVNITNFLLDENVNIFYWRKMSMIFFGPKYQYIPLDQNVNKLSLLDENVTIFFIGPKY